VSKEDHNWVTIERPGYFGAEREAKYKEYNFRFGVNKWRLAWEMEGEFISWDEMVLYYEQSYFVFLQNNPDVLQELVTEASNVYDDAITNIKSGFDYTAQETDRTHVQDIAIRRVVVRLGKKFEGQTPIQIRDVLGDHPLSVTLSPGKVPFHMPEALILPELLGWWDKGSVESFYQSNKTLQSVATA
jgi:hypothetical protein